MNGVQVSPSLAHQPSLPPQLLLVRQELPGKQRTQRPVAVLQPGFATPLSRSLSVTKYMHCVGAAVHQVQA